MIVYKVFSRDDENERVTLLGLLAERRRDLRGKTRTEAGLTWARLTFGDSTKERESIFVVPREFEAGHATKILAKRTIFYKDELLEMLDPLAPSQKIRILAREGETMEADRANRSSDFLLDVIGEVSSYPAFYGFSAKPFEAVPDPQFFYSSSSHLNVLTSVIHGVESRKHLICVSGEVGAGKTTLVHFLFHYLEEKVKTVVIVHPPMTFEEWVSSILLGLNEDGVGETKQALLNQLNRYLTEGMNEEETLVVIVDEAQNLPLEVMEELGTIFDGESWPARLQIIFVGAPEFMDKISTPRLRLFDQKIGLRCQITALTEEESKSYIDHRLKLVGSGSREVFTPGAISRIVRYARGFPRVINIICDNAFMMGYGLSKTKIDEDIVQKVIAINEMEFPTQPKSTVMRMVMAVKEIRFMARALNFLRLKFLSSFCL
jgi:type II secretory pathway predicted ATPase ExeA